MLGKSIPGRGNSRCKDPGAGVYLACLQKCKKASVAGVAAYMTVKEVRAVMWTRACSHCNDCGSCPNERGCLWRVLSR